MITLKIFLSFVQEGQHFQYFTEHNYPDLFHWIHQSIHVENENVCVDRIFFTLFGFLPTGDSFKTTFNIRGTDEVIYESLVYF